MNNGINENAGNEPMSENTDTTAKLENTLIEVVIEGWRFSRLFARLIGKLDAGESSRYTNQLRYFQKRIEESLEASGMKVVNVEGQPFDPGMAVSAINIGDFDPDDVLVVEQMVEPILMGREGLRRQGTVTLKKTQA